MNPLLRKLFGFSLYDDNPDSGPAPDAPAPAQGAEPEPVTDAAVSEGMAEAIGKALKGDKDDKKATSGGPGAGAEKVEPTEAAEKKVKTEDKTEVKTADEIKAEADAAVEKKKKDQAESLAKKKADDFQFSTEERKALGQKANLRFHELHQFAKLKEAEVTRLSEENAGIKQARDEMLNIFTEHKATGEDVAQLLSYNRLVKEGKLEDALKVVESQRATILKALGRDAPGFDALDEFADLKERVDALDLKREDALQIAASRRSAAAQQQERENQNRQQTREQQIEQAQEDGYKSIEVWEKGLQGKDIDYVAKRDKLSAKGADGKSHIERVILKYPAHLWASTLQALYESIAVEKAPAPDPGSLRPSGRFAGKPDPASMEEAIGNAVGVRM